MKKSPEWCSTVTPFSHNLNIHEPTHCNTNSSENHFKKFLFNQKKKNKNSVSTNYGRNDWNAGTTRTDDYHVHGITLRRRRDDRCRFAGGHWKARNRIGSGLKTRAVRCCAEILFNGRCKQGFCYSYLPGPGINYARINAGWRDSGFELDG